MDTTLNEFSRLYVDYLERFIRFANTYVHDFPVAEDIAVDAFVYYWENHQTLPENTNIPAYIITTIKHKCLNHLEHLRVRAEYAERMKEDISWELELRMSTLQACDPEALFVADIKRISDKTIKALPSQTRTIFNMSRQEYKSNKEIAEQLQIAVKTVEYHITKAISVLRIALKDYMIFFLILIRVVGF
jgi:RNA polymerase sigma-70 factor (ECF subfamily)